MPAPTKSEYTHIRIRAGQGRAGQGRAGQGRAGQSRAGQGRAALGAGTLVLTLSGAVEAEVS